MEMLNNLVLQHELVKQQFAQAKLGYEKKLDDYHREVDRLKALLEGQRGLKDEISSKLDLANDKYRQACERIDILKRNISESQERSSAHQLELDALKEAHLSKLSELDEATGKYFEVCQRVDGLEKTNSEYQKQSIKLKFELDSLQETHLTKVSELDEATDKYFKICQRVDELEKINSECQEQSRKLQLELDSLQDAHLAKLPELEHALSELGNERRLHEATSGKLKAIEDLAIARQSVQDILRAQEADRNWLQLFELETRNRTYLAEVAENVVSLHRMAFREKQAKAQAEYYQNNPIAGGVEYFLKMLPKKIASRLLPFYKQSEQEELSQQPLFSGKTLFGNSDQVMFLESAAKKLACLQQDHIHPLRLKGVRVAAIMDEFTHSSYHHECNLLQLTPQHWQNELSQFIPELLFIESAWRGKCELWGSKVGHKSAELQGIVAWCREHGVPTIFWNKEDPVHFETFLSTAKLFDYVFTTDIDCIHRYKAALEHERVYFLPFAAQPITNNPVESYERKDAFCFAGAYYVRYPDRTRDLDDFVGSLTAYLPFEIYDRNYGKDDLNYQFPEQYRPYIVGNLPFSEIDRAYKGYTWAINLNSIKHSQSMFARRVYELLASNTLTVSNFSRGLRLMFGDLVFTADSGSEILHRIQAQGGLTNRLERLRLLGLRKVFSEHTYRHRFAYVVSKALGLAADVRQPTVLMTAYARDAEQLDNILSHFRRQAYPQCALLVAIRDGFVPDSQPEDERIVFVPAGMLSDPVLGKQITRVFDWLAAIVPEDYYGENYLTDLMLASGYCNAEIIGKHSHYLCSPNGGLSLQQAGHCYHRVDKLLARAALLRASSLYSHVDDLSKWFTGVYRLELHSPNGLSIDPFNYCRNQSRQSIPKDVLADVLDLTNIDAGLAFSEMVARAERIAPERQTTENVPVMGGGALAALFCLNNAKQFDVQVQHDVLEVSSRLSDGKHEYLYAVKDLAPESLGFSNGVAHFYLDLTPGLNLQLVLLFLDSEKRRLSHAMLHGNRNQEIPIPAGGAWVRLGLRVFAGGHAGIRSLVMGSRAINPAEIIGRANTLLLTNHYPSYDDIYRNGFVHSRVHAYRERGVKLDIFRLRPHQMSPIYHEFKEVDVITASKVVLRQILGSGQYSKVLVHFLDSEMWEVLCEFDDTIEIVVWVHGSEVQPWYRRDFNYANDAERDAAKVQSDERMIFWRRLFGQLPENVKFVFVSRYFAEEVMEDVAIRLPESQYCIIHNPIDTVTFKYFEKSLEQRNKILSIRPYASKKYANDLSVAAILELSSKPYFNDLKFLMVGEGKLFVETLEPIRHFSNVEIRRGFMTHPQIAMLHRDYGLFLCPTRMDAQGVSKDEAMSSGLVPITNGVTAIPEFIDETCGILAPGEDAKALAEGMANLIEHPEIFAKMSANAAARVRRQSANEIVIAQELDLIGK